jgi:sugar/nucleoside kinase (ribokinase family)
LTIVCLGEAIADLVCERELAAPEDADAFVPHPGGALANVAVAVARAGGDAALLGGVGDDPWGRWLRRGLEAEGVHCGWLATVPSAPTPLAIVTFGRGREPTFLVYGAGIAETMQAGGAHLEAAMAEASAMVFGSNTLVGEPERRVTLEARRRALDLGVPILFDPNLRPNRWPEMEVAIGFCRELCDGAFLVRANREEAAQLTGVEDPESAASALCGLGARLGVVTMGAEGAVIRGEASGQAASAEVEVVAPLGAGDAFMGALAAGLAELAWDPAQAARALPAATAAGARACEGWGAQ